MSIGSLSRRRRSADADLLAVAIEPEFDFRSPEFEALQRRSRTTAFQHAAWLDELYRTVVPALAAEPRTITVRAKDTGRLLLVLPLVRRRRGGLLIVEFADLGLSDYVASIHDPHEVPILLADRALPARVDDLLACDVVSLRKLPGVDPVLERLLPNARRAAMRVSAYPANLGADFAEWRTANMDRSFRRHLDSKRRRLAKSGTTTFALVRDEAEIARAFAALRHFRADRFREMRAHDVVANNAIFAFYRNIAVDGARTGSARTFCLYLDGEPVAVVFGLAHCGTFLMLLAAFDLARYRRFSLGLLAIEDSLRASIEAGDKVYDFTIGDHPYKLQFAARAKPLYEWHVPRSLRGRFAVIGIEMARETKRMLKRLLQSGGRLTARLRASRGRRDRSGRRN